MEPFELWTHAFTLSHQIRNLNAASGFFALLVENGSTYSLCPGQTKTLLFWACRACVLKKLKQLLQIVFCNPCPPIFIQENIARIQFYTPGVFQVIRRDEGWKRCHFSSVATIVELGVPPVPLANLSELSALLSLLPSALPQSSTPPCKSATFSQEFKQSRLCLEAEDRGWRWINVF